MSEPIENAIERLRNSIDPGLDIDLRDLLAEVERARDSSQWFAAKCDALEAELSAVKVERDGAKYSAESWERTARDGAMLRVQSEKALATARDALASVRGQITEARIQLEVSEDVDDGAFENANVVLQNALDRIDAFLGVTP